MLKRSLGIGGPLRLTETTRSHTFFSPLHWLTLVSLTRHALQHRRALRLIRSSRSACFAPIALATIRRTSRVESGHIRACAWRGYQRDDVGDGSRGNAMSLNESTALMSGTWLATPKVPSGSPIRGNYGITYVNEGGNGLPQWDSWNVELPPAPAEKASASQQRTP